MYGLDFPTSRQFQEAVVATRRQIHLTHRGAYQTLTIGLELES